MNADDALYRFRLRIFALAEELGHVRAACRAMGIHHSTFYRWRRDVLRFGLEMLRPRERRPAGFCQISDHGALQAPDLVVARPAAGLGESCFPAPDGAGFRVVV